MNFFKAPKSFIAFLLIFLFAFHLNGQFLVFKLFEYKIKKEIKTRIKAGVPEEELVLLKIPKLLEENPNKDFTRIHEKEFRYKGEMYDIVNQEDKVDTTYYYCIHDVKESNLFANLESMIADELNNPEKKKELSSVTNILTGVYIKSETGFLLKPLTSEIKFIFLPFKIFSIQQNPLTPPPKLAA